MVHPWAAMQECIYHAGFKVPLHLSANRAAKTGDCMLYAPQGQSQRRVGIFDLTDNDFDTCHTTETANHGRRKGKKQSPSHR